MAEDEMEVPEEQRIEQKEEYAVAKEPTEQRQELEKKYSLQNIISINQNEDKSIFVHGLSAGLGCIAAFIIM